MCCPARWSAVAPPYSRIVPVREHRYCLRGRHQRSRTPSRRLGSRPPCRDTSVQGPVGSPCLSECPLCAVSFSLFSSFLLYSFLFSVFLLCSSLLPIFPPPGLVLPLPFPHTPAAGARVGAEAHEGVAALVFPAHGLGAEQGDMPGAVVAVDVTNRKRNLGRTWFRRTRAHELCVRFPHLLYWETKGAQSGRETILPRSCLAR